MITPQGIVDSIVLGIEQAPNYRDDDHLWNRASSLGWADDCLLYLIRRRMTPELEVKGPKSKAVFHEGHTQEIMMRKEFSEYAAVMGAKVESVVPMTSEAYKISGEVDNILRADKPYSIDYKSASPHMFTEVDKMGHASDLLVSDHSWVRHYPAQLLTYNQLYNIEDGVLYFKDKVFGGRKLIDVRTKDFHDYIHILLEAVEKVNAAVDKGDMPAPEYKEACDTCGFFGACWPERLVKTEPRLIDSEELELILQRRQELAEAAKEYDRLDKEVKPVLRQMGDHFIIGGKYAIENVTYKQSAYLVPPEVKEKYKSVVQRVRTNIKNLKSAI